MSAQFLFNKALWDELESRVLRARRVRAAVAYLGAKASVLLPLRKGDKLVVDMSLRAVRSGTTDPREVKKLLQRGVEVFSRGRLHAKFFIIDKILIAGSSNVSRHARDFLDEAAILTSDSAAIRRALSTFDELCTEPIRKDYLERCIGEYEPPKFLPGRIRTSKRDKKPLHAKLWIVGGLRYSHIPEHEQPHVDRLVKQVQRKLFDFEHSEVEYSHYSVQRRFFKSLREGDWLITCIRDGRGFDVSPPARFLGINDYPRGRGKRRYLLQYEMPKATETIRWTTLRKCAPSKIAALQWDKPRTVPISDDRDADALLRLWDVRGRFRGGTR